MSATDRTRQASAASPLLHDESSALTPGSARSLLLTILGELVWPTDEPVWSSTLIDLLRDLHVEEQSARQAIARAASSEWIVPERRGRQVRWTLGERLERIFETGTQRVLSLSDNFTEWDGKWLAVLVTVPATHRSARRPLYAGLSWAGLGNPGPGLWLTPHVERADEVRALIASLNLDDQTVSLVGRVGDIGLTDSEIVSRGWDLDALSGHYRDVLDAIDRLDPSPGEPTVHAFIRMIAEWQDFPRTDPQLPEALLPNWIGRTVATRIEELRARWTQAVRATYTGLNARQ